MNGRIVSVLTGMLLAAAPTAHAAPVQWVFGGVFTAVDRTNWSGLPLDVSVGNTFQLTVSFDSNAQLRNKLADPLDGSGHRYNYYNNSLGMAFKAGAVEGAFANDVQHDIIVRDGYPVSLPPGVDQTQTDGFTFQLTDVFGGNENGTELDLNVTVVLRSTDLDNITVVNDLIPTEPLALHDLSSNAFQICRYAHGGTLDCQFGAVDGRFTSVFAVGELPEPASAALLLTGLGLMGLSGRRRRPTA